MTEQNKYIKHATAKDAVLTFITERAKLTGEESSFTADQLRFYVNNTISGTKGVSPSTADRVLRQLRQAGQVDYLVLNRGKSLYRAVPLGTTIPPAVQNADPTTV